MFFSEYFEIDPRLLLEYGALDISLVCDLPLFIDPMLIFNSNKPEYKKLHEGIIKYFYFLAQKAQNKLQKNEIKAWFKFSEVKNNWLGYSFAGNGGLALGTSTHSFYIKISHLPFLQIIFLKVRILRKSCCSMREVVKTK